MIIGINLLLWTARLEPAQGPVLAGLKAMGYGGVEVPFFEGTARQARAAGQMVRDAGLVPALIGTLPDAAHNPLSEDAAVARRGADHLLWIVDMAQEMGAGVIAGPFTQPLGRFTGRGITAAEWARLVVAHRAMADRAGPDLRLAVEPLNRFECYALTTASDAARLVAEVGRANYGYLYDTFHAHIEEGDPTRALRDSLPAVAHFHLSENHRGTPGTGHAALVAALQTLQSGGFDHWISVEAFGQSLPEIAAATRIWRRLFDDELALALTAITLIKSHMTL